VALPFPFVLESNWKIAIKSKHRNELMKFCCWMINDRIRMVDIGSDVVVAGNDVGKVVGNVVGRRVFGWGPELVVGRGVLGW
jgi:hypothetical protein